VSPRYPAQEPSIALIAPQQPPPLTDPRDVAVREREDDRRYLDALERERNDPYGGGRHSFFRDLIAVAEAQLRRDGTFEQPRFARGEAPGPPPGWSMPSEAEALARLNAWHRRDLSGAGSPDMMRPNAPLAGVFGQAARQVGKLASVFNRVPLTRGMVDVSGGVPQVSVPRLATGASVTAGVENSAVSETDPTSSAAASAVGTISGLVDLSLQLVDFARPVVAMDTAIMDDLGRAYGSTLDAQLISGAGSGGATKGLLNWASILSVTGSVTNVESFIESCWKAFSQAAGASGFGNPDPADYFTIIHPRRLAWASGGSGSTTMPTAPLLPGTVVASGGIPTSLGGGTNEDIVILVEKSNVLLMGGEAKFRAFPEIGSSTLTARIRVHADVVLLLLNPKALCKVTGLTAPAGF
jgi:Phage capsid family